MHIFSFSKFRFLASEKQVTIIVFVICISVSAIPELAAYPHPIGYDVINYYIPKVVNFQEEWVQYLSISHYMSHFFTL